jgi:hypothetical protein
VEMPNVVMLAQEFGKSELLNIDADILNCRVEQPIIGIFLPCPEGGEGQNLHDDFS